MLILLVMSSGTGVTDAPSGEAALRTEANERPVRNTRHPRVANCRTTSSPMPLLAPVTKAMPGIDKPPVLVPSHPPNPGAIISTRPPTDCLAIVYPERALFPIIGHYILCGENTGWACPQ